ncbi:hypothetical protein AB0I28_07435 [Phytomonospora sp. NPDC050363]|uniref:hypothetical protein n=1 Tax=Phytomonospora sp. NPDC050363 TaxID=3155642 RepID=UPI0033F95BC5
MPPSRNRATLSSFLAAATVLALAACTNATVTAPAWGEPLDAVKNAAERLAGGVSFQGWLTVGGDTLSVHGDDIPAEDKLRHYQQLSGSGGSLTTEVRFIGSDAWMRVVTPEADTGWGHFGEAGTIRDTSGVVGPSTWLPLLLDEVIEIERDGDRTYAGVLDFDAVDVEGNGLGRSLSNSLGGDAEEVEFSVLLNKDGTVNTVKYEIENTEFGDIEVMYSFSLHGAPNDVTTPDGKIVEIEDNALEWFGGL